MVLTDVNVPFDWGRGNVKKGRLVARVFKDGWNSTLASTRSRRKIGVPNVKLEQYQKDIEGV